jgi:hypothetical protein
MASRIPASNQPRSSTPRTQCISATASADDSSSSWGPSRVSRPGGGLVWMPVLAHERSSAVVARRPMYPVGPPSPDRRSVTILRRGVSCRNDRRHPLM